MLSLSEIQHGKSSNFALHPAGESAEFASNA